jgi:hypothetical protein
MRSQSQMQRLSLALLLKTNVSIMATLNICLGTTKSTSKTKGRKSGTSTSCISIIKINLVVFSESCVFDTGSMIHTDKSL